jgi:3-hydroxyisobutyrate dehydrogenase
MKREREGVASPRLGFVGLGNMGTPMCRRLLEAGYRVAVYDVERARMAHLVEAGAEPVDSVAVLGLLCDIALLSLPTSHIIEEVVLGSDGLAATMRTGTVLIDLSSAQPSSTRRLAAALASRGIAMLDAPVSGGVPRALDGTLAVMVGGDREVFERCRPILEVISSTQFHVGGSGAGHLTKALNNLLSATTLASAAEVALLAERAGLDLKQFIEVVNNSSGRSNSTEVKFPRYILTGTFADGFALSLMMKDVDIALQTASELDVPLKLGAVSAQMWRAAADAGFAQLGHTAIYTFLRELLMEAAPTEPPASHED